MIRTPPSTAATLRFATLAVLLDSVAVAAALIAPVSSQVPVSSQIPVTVAALFAHLLAVGALFAYRSRSSTANRRSPGGLLALVMTAVGGPPGAVAAVVMALVLWVSPAVLPTPDPAGSGREKHEKPARRSDLELKLEPLCDVFRFGSLSQRRNAVSLIAANYNPTFSRALKMALRDENNAIRVQAGMVVQQLEDRYESEARELEAAADNAMEAHGFGSGDIHLRLAKFYDEYAFSGVLDDRRMRGIHAKSLRSYRHHLARNPSDVVAIAAVGRLLIRAGQHGVVADWLAEHVAGGRGSPTILMWMAEALYRSGRHAELRALLQRHGSVLSRHVAANSNFGGVLTLWQTHPEMLDPDSPASVAPQLRASSPDNVLRAVRARQPEADIAS